MVEALPPNQSETVKEKNNRVRLLRKKLADFAISSTTQSKGGGAGADTYKNGSCNTPNDEGSHQMINGPPQHKWAMQSCGDPLHAGLTVAMTVILTVTMTVTVCVALAMTVMVALAMTMCGGRYVRGSTQTPTFSWDE